MKLLFCTCLLLLSFIVLAEEDCDTPPPAGTKDLIKVAKVAVKQTECPNGSKLPNLCIEIGERQKDLSGQYLFHYQKTIAEAACVTSKDNESTRNLKIQKMWKQFEEKLTCNNTRFDVKNGSVLKFAVSTRFEDFLFDAAMIWKVNLNKVDKSDNRTVLDYVQSEIELNKGTAIEADLKSYYDMLRSSGAKLRSEL